MIQHINILGFRNQYSARVARQGGPPGGHTEATPREIRYSKLAGEHEVQGLSGDKALAGDTTRTTCV